MDTFDIAVIGGGPGGYVAAIRAAQLGFSTAVIEKEQLGGICLNWGCIPTKALLRSAEVLHLLQRADEFGITTSGKITPDIGAMVKRSRQVSTRLHKGVGHLLKKNKVTVFSGRAEIPSAGKIAILSNRDQGTNKQQVIAAKHTIIATGASPRTIPGINLDNPDVWTYRQALEPKRIPDSIAIIGAGAIGVEFASFYNQLGSKVTLIELAEQILPSEDTEIANYLQQQLTRHGIKIITNAKVSKLIKTGKTQQLHYLEGDQPAVLACEKIIVSVGVKGNIADLHLDKLTVKTKHECIETDGWGRTSVKGIYAIGDVSGPPMLAHKAEHEGVICVEAIAGKTVHPLQKQRIPGCIYCMPQVASIGLTEQQARQAGLEIRVGKFPFSANGKALALAEDKGFSKTIFAKATGELVGAHLVGSEVTELIHGFAIAIGMETTEEELIHTVFPHPTLSETMHESVLQAFSKAIHI